ncbi:MAG: hypothetical protein ACKOC8_10540 [Pirellulales bacterium]
MQPRPAMPDAGRAAGPRSPAFPPAILRLAGVLCIGIAATARGAGLDAPVQASWTRVPLRDWAERASDLAGVPVIIDRRLDPTTLITLDSRGEPLGAVLDRVAAGIAATSEPLASSVRIVPAAHRGICQAAEAARTAAIAKLPARMRTALGRRALCSWPAGAEPRRLVASAAAEAGLTVTGLDDIPHDHLPATALPPLALAERLDLVLAHYDRRIDWTAAGGAVVPIDAGLAQAADTAPAPRRPAQPKHRGPRDAAGGQQVFSLRLAAPLDQAIAALAGRLGLEHELDGPSLEARGIAAGEIVRVDVRNVGRDELLDAVVKPLGLEWAIDGTRLRVFAAAVAPAASAEAIGRILAHRDGLPSVHAERPAIDAALAAAGVDADTVAALWSEVERAVLPGVGSRLDSFLFLTGEPRWLGLRERFAEFLVLPGVTAVTPEIAAALAPYEGYVSLPGIAELTPESAAALAAFGADSWSAGVELPAITTLSPDAARALARCRALLVLPGMRELAPDAAQALALHEGVGLVIGGIGRLPVDVAERLGGCQSAQGLLLPDLVVLDSTTLARRLSRQDTIFLPAVRSLEPGIAATLAGRSHRIALDGLEELDTATAAALTTHPGELSLRGLRRISAGALKLLQARNDVTLPPTADLVIVEETPR